MLNSGLTLPFRDPMSLKHVVVRALKNIIHRQAQMNLSSRFLFMKILKSVSALDDVPSLESLKTQRFVREKSYQKILLETQRLCKKPGFVSAIGDVVDSFCGTSCLLASDSACKLEQGCGRVSGNVLQMPPDSHVVKEDSEYYSDSSIIVCNQTQFQEISSNGSDCIVVAGAGSRDEEELFNSLSDLRLDSSKSGQQRANDVEVTDEDGAQEDARIDKPVARKRRYVPGYRTAPYAMLRALHEHDGSHRHLIALKAAQHTDTEFDSRQAFSALRTLIKKELVCEESTRYRLTRVGSELCSMLFGDASTPAGDQVARLVIDCREKKSGKDRVFFQSHFLSRGIPCETRFLSVGDFLWIRNENVMGWIVERKQCTDFASSISDGRYREQKHRLKSLGMCVYYLVENLKVDDSKKNYVRRCLLETKMDGFVVMETESISESAWVLEMIDRKVRGLISVSTQDPVDSAHSMSYGSFLDETGKSNFRTGDMLLMALLGIKGLSKEFAIALSEKYCTLSIFRRGAGSDAFVNEIKAFRAGKRELGERMARKVASMMR